MCIAPYIRRSGDSRQPVIIGEHLLVFLGQLEILHGYLIGDATSLISSNRPLDAGK
jgi:hypothetical protein